MCIEAILSDCKKGGYNLEGSQANIQRLTNLILLVAIAYTAEFYFVIIKKLGYQRYIFRLNEPGRRDRIDSNFCVGMYGELWVLAGDYLVDIFQQIIKLNPQKKSDYQRGLKAVSMLDNI